MSRRPINPSAGLAAELEALRLQLGLSVGAWCQRLDLPPQTYLRWRRGGPISRPRAIQALARWIEAGAAKKNNTATPPPAGAYAAASDNFKKT